MIDFSVAAGYPIVVISWGDHDATVTWIDERRRLGTLPTGITELQRKTMALRLRYIADYLEGDQQ